MTHNDYYVYVHRRKDTGEVFYVGHGRKRRATSGGDSKTKNWLLVVENSGGYFVEYLHTGLTKKESEQLELKYITNPLSGWSLINKRLPVKRLSIDYGEISKLWAYDESSPSGLIWIGSKFSTFNGNPAGSIQNTSRGKQYWVVRKDRRLFLAHRVIYVLLNKEEIPKDKVIDHIDGNGLNNKIENIRLVSQIENCISSNKSKSNTGQKHITKQGSFLVLDISNEYNGKIIRKRSILKYGYEEALKQLVNIRDAFLKQQENLYASTRILGVPK